LKENITKEISEAAYARLKRGFTLTMVGRRINKGADYVRVCETRGCGAYGTAWRLHCVTGARIEDYQFPRKIAIPQSEYRELCSTALENEKNDHR